MMGMYSTVVDDSIEVRDKKALREWCEDKRIPEYLGYLEEAQKEEYNFFKGELLKQMDDDDELLSTIFNDKKIYGYWYAGTCAFIRDLAQFVTGTIELEYEDRGNYARLDFDDGGVSVEFGKIVFDGAVSIEECSGRLEELPEREKLLRAL